MLIVFLLFLLLLLLGMPVAYAVGISGVTYFLQHTEIPLLQIAQLALSQIQSVNLLAVPLFIFAGNLMNLCGITDRLLGLASIITRHMYGGMAQTSVVMSTLMGGVSGSSTADAAMESRVLGPTMIHHGYSRGYTAVVIGYTSLITSTIPPGVNLIVYGTTGSVSVGRLFTAGLMSGLYMMIALMLTVHFTSKKRGYRPPNPTRASFKEIMREIKSSFWALLFPVILLVGIRLGMFTASEVGAFACVYAMVVGICIYRQVSWKNFKKCLQTSISDVGGIMFMISLTGVFSYGIPVEKIPQKITTFMLSMTDSATLILIMILALLFLLGMLMDGGVIVLLLTPILLPVAKAIGLDPVFFGIVMCTVCCLGILTPPVGVAMYIVCGTLKVDMKTWIKESIPFLITIIVVILLFVLFPNLITFLPNLVYG